MSEPTQESLKRIQKLNSQHALSLDDLDERHIAIAFDDIRREERAKCEREERARQGHTEFCVPKEKAEKLAEALRWLAEWQHEGRDPGHCNRKIEDCPHHACRRVVAALRVWEGAQHG